MQNDDVKNRNRSQVLAPRPFPFWSAIVRWEGCGRHSFPIGLPDQGRKALRHVHGKQLVHRDYPRDSTCCTTQRRNEFANHDCSRERRDGGITTWLNCRDRMADNKPAANFRLRPDLSVRYCRSAAKPSPCHQAKSRERYDHADAGLIRMRASVECVTRR